MTPDPVLRGRLGFLARVLRREREHLQTTDKRLFSEPFTPERTHGLDNNVEEAERIEAFVSRFARLQDTVGDKLLSAHLAALDEDLSTEGLLRGAPAPAGSFDPHANSAGAS